MVWGKAFSTIFVASLFAASALGMDTRDRTAAPGELNYVEGTASIGDQTLNSKSIGSAQLEAGQFLST